MVPSPSDGAAAAGPHGVLLCDKPPGWSSHDVVAVVRGRIGRGTRVGHAGTLDPFATGLLLVLLGRATRVQRLLVDLPKTYRATARLGARSATADPEGTIVLTGRRPPEPLALPTGEVRQRPPAHSAVRIGGQRAYARARRGEEVVVPERTVRVHEHRRLGPDDGVQARPDRAELLVRCSAGTYVRSLVAEHADAYCLALRRTAVGPFAVQDAGHPREVDLGALVGFDALLPTLLPVVDLDAEQGRRAGHGQAVPGAARPAGSAPAGPGAGHEHQPGDAGARPEEVVLRDPAGVVALARPAADGRWAPAVGFRG